MRITLAAVLLVVAVSSWQPEAAAADPPAKAYLLFPVRTQLQQEISFDPSVRYYLLVHGDSLITADGKLDALQLDFADLSDDIGHFRVLRKGDKIVANVIFANRPPEPAARLLKFAIHGWAMEMGYMERVPIHVIGDSDWNAATKLTNDSRGLFEEDESEDAVGDDVVRAYPVRTALSRLQFSEANCVVSFRQPFRKDSTGTLDEKARDRIRDLVDSLKLKERHRIQFSIQVKDDVNAKAVAQFSDTTARELTDAMGFKDYSVLKDWAK